MARLKFFRIKLIVWINAWRKGLKSALPPFGIAGLVVAFISGVVAVAFFASQFPYWTGFGKKTLWDWLDLLLVPLVIAVGGYFLTRSESRYGLKLQERRGQDTALQSYLDQMTQLLLDKKLRTSSPDDEVRSVARARTLSVLRALDGVRKATVLQFLYEAGLIGSIKQEKGGLSETIDAVVSLQEANLQEVRLNSAQLQGVNLQRANLQRANLQSAYLDGANLQGADLRGAILSQAFLDEATLAYSHLEEAKLVGTNLNRAKLSWAHLERAHLFVASLQGADLSGAFLYRTHLEEAILDGANLEKADLSRCNVTREQLSRARSLKDATLPFDMAPPASDVEVNTPKDQATDLQAATMPDGSKHE